MDESNINHEFKYHPVHMSLNDVCPEVPVRAVTRFRVLGTDNNNIYTIAYDGDDPDVRNEIWKYNFASMEWEMYELSNTKLPKKIQERSIVMNGRILLVYGGYHTGVNISNNFYVCDLSVKKTRFKLIKATGDRPQKRLCQNIFWKDKHVYAVGGFKRVDDYKMDFYRLNFESGEWKEFFTSEDAPNKPTGRIQFTISIVENKIYLFGGMLLYPEFVTLEEVPVFDLELKRWELVKTIPDCNYGYPEPRIVPLVYNDPLDGNLYVFGGINLSHNNLGKWKLDLSTHSWKRYNFEYIHDMPMYSKNTVTTTSGKNFSIAQIKMKNTSGRTIDYEFVAPKLYTSYICVPKLEDIAFDAFVHYGKIYKNNPNELKGMLLPKYHSRFLL